MITSENYRELSNSDTMAKAQPYQAPMIESDVRLETTAAIIDKRLRDKKRLPLDVLMDVMDVYMTQENFGAAMSVAIEASRFVHPRLQDVLLVSAEARAKITNSKGLSKSELAQLESLLDKVAGANEE